MVKKYTEEEAKERQKEAFKRYVAKNGKYQCEVCNCEVSFTVKGRHMKTKKHLKLLIDNELKEPEPIELVK